MAYWDHDIKLSGVDHCYDCRAMIEILTQYNMKIKNPWSIPEWIEYIEDELRQPLLCGAHGHLPDERNRAVRDKALANLSFQDREREVAKKKRLHVKEKQVKEQHRQYLSKKGFDKK
jgi:hypothetical protein